MPVCPPQAGQSSTDSLTDSSADSLADLFADSSAVSSLDSSQDAGSTAPAAPSLRHAPPPDPACVNLRWALALLDGLSAAGIEHLVISPGSRSTPVVLAAQRRPALTLTPILDERSAAFFALGLARASGRPVALLATSGSAPAHWYPAVMEANEAGLPLILLSADRPPELRGWGANQTTDQTRLFGVQVRAFFDPGAPMDDPALRRGLTALGYRAARLSQGQRPGPVHINLPFREPLVPAADRGSPSSLPEEGQEERDSPSRHLAPFRLPGEGREDEIRPSRHPSPSPLAEQGRVDKVSPSQHLPPSPLAGEGWGEGVSPSWQPPRLPSSLKERLRGRGLIYCGPDLPRPGFPAAVLRCAAALGVPVLADPLSEPRFGQSAEACPWPLTRPWPLVSRYKLLARNPAAAAALRPDWVLRFGRAPISKSVLDWLRGIPLILVDPAERWTDPHHDLALASSLHLALDPLALCQALTADPPAPAAQNWLEHWSRAEARLASLSADYLTQVPWCEAHLITDLIAQLPPGEGLLCANSLPIRQFETWSGTRTAPLAVFGNRGLSGIDGQLSTLAGLNASGLPTTGLLGDLSFLHDLSGLLLARHLHRPCIVINNGGGRIFDYLPQHGLPGFERLWRTPQTLDLPALSQAFGLHHRRVSEAPAWRTALAEGLSGRQGLVIEVLIDADQSLETHLQFRRRVAAEDLLGA